MRIALCTFCGACVVLPVAALSGAPEPDRTGGLDLRWTGTTSSQKYRLKGRYTVLGLTDGSLSSLSSPVNEPASHVVLAAGLYSLELQPGARVCFEHERGAFANARRDQFEGCWAVQTTNILVLVEAGGHRDVGLSLSVGASEVAGAPSKGE